LVTVIVEISSADSPDTVCPLIVTEYVVGAESGSGVVPVIVAVGVMYLVAVGIFSL
jgi:hypothetical protein